MEAVVVEVGYVAQEFEFDEQENPYYRHSFAFAFCSSYDKANSRTPSLHFPLHLLFSCLFCHSLATTPSTAKEEENEVYSVAQWVSRDPSSGGWNSGNGGWASGGGDSNESKHSWDGFGPIGVFLNGWRSKVVVDP
ncbi:hypothetical protein Fot_25255 [Forsythia ovata]|uniref:Uncharacterized protein n=1 Tax=Forsythia ovata TaxID=205694 RepID=A0ABD1U8M1_9LAMI